MRRVSDYRLRLFLSVDLAGSTAFKAGAGRKSANPASPHPLWIVVIREFYESFPSILKSCYNNRLRFEQDTCLDESSMPQSWKTIGDEIIFCCRLVDSKHIRVCILSFIQALEDYGFKLENSGLQLDVKGTAWVAAFPAVNMTATRSVLKRFDYLREEFEAGADKTPVDFDFLGPEIDAGFRVSKHSSPDKCAISLELAWLLTRQAVGVWNADSFLYSGRDQMKGVINDRPYPVICLVTERQTSRTDLREKEARLMGDANYTVNDIHSFLNSFMELEKIEFPFLPIAGVASSAEALPISYRNFRTQAELELKDIIEQDKQLSESGDAENDVSDQIEMPDAITDAALLYGRTENNKRKPEG